MPVAVNEGAKPAPVQAPPESVIKRLRNVIEPELLIESMTTPREAATEASPSSRRLTPSHIACPRWQATPSPAWATRPRCAPWPKRPNGGAPPEGGVRTHASPAS